MRTAFKVVGVIFIAAVVLFAWALAQAGKDEDFWNE